MTPEKRPSVLCLDCGATIHKQAVMGGYDWTDERGERACLVPDRPHAPALGNDPSAPTP